MAGIDVVKVGKRFGQTVVLENLDFQVEDGEFVVILGPSGCGKSTLLKIIAGIEAPTAGSVYIGGRDCTRVHPRDRDIAMVFQDYALYPHMSVEKNLTFGPKARKRPKDETAARVLQTAEVLGIADLLHRKPGQLSGGQRQRVALGRAMMRDPHAYLMDEPLSNLDAALRVQMRAELISFHRATGRTALYVTHDQIEAMTMGQRIAVMNKGRFEQIGTPGEVYGRPATVFVARFLGSPSMNIVDVSLRLDGNVVIVEHERLRWQIPARALPPDLPAVCQLGFRPEAMRVDASTDPTAATTRLAIDFVEHLGNEVIVHVADKELVARVPASAEHMLGAETTWSIPCSDIHLFGPEGAAFFHGDDLSSQSSTPVVGAAS